MTAVGCRRVVPVTALAVYYPAAFEPALDYGALKVPRFTSEKFPAADPVLTTTMKSVGESMALGRNFTEALQKAMRSIDKAEASFHWRGEAPSTHEVAALLTDIATPTEGRLVAVQQALRGGATVDDVHAATQIDPWFLDQIALLNEVAAKLQAA